MNFILFDEEINRKNLLPLTFTRPVGEIRVGILTIREKWERFLGVPLSYCTQSYLSKKYPQKDSSASVFINGKVLPNLQLTETLKNLNAGDAVLSEDADLLAYCGDLKELQSGVFKNKVFFTADVFRINHVWDIFQKNGKAIQDDFQLLTQNRTSFPLSKSVTVIGDKNLVFLEEGAKAEACILNTTGGPVYLDKDAEIMEGSIVRGPFSLGEHSALKLGAKVYGPTTIGPHSKVGGEVSNSVIFGFSNKAHDGFLGNSVIAEWCNLGADTNNSNLKNNYGNVKLFSYMHNKPVDTGLQFCGLIMGDHSKSGINTMFNTGTVVGVAANVYGGGFPSTHIPSFSWGGSEGFETYKLEKLFETAEKVYERRGLVFNQTEKDILRAVFEKTS